MTIEERAKVIINKKYSGWDFELKRWATECCIEIATEQDAISRQEERERCINAAIKAHCSFCPNYLFDCSLCNEKEIIRKAIEENSSKNY